MFVTRWKGGLLIFRIFGKCCDPLNYLNFEIPEVRRNGRL